MLESELVKLQNSQKRSDVVGCCNECKLPIIYLSPTDVEAFLDTTKYKERR